MGPRALSVSPLRAGWRCRCPRCGEGRLYSGFLEVAATCPACGLDMRGQDSGDGPAVFVMFIVGAVVVALAFTVEVSYHPPLWVHALLWPPLIIGGSLALLRPVKGILLAQQYRLRSFTDDAGE